MNDILWPKVWALLATPPGIIILFGLLGLFFSIWRRWVGGIMIALSLIALFVVSVPLIGKRLLMQLETPFREQVVVPDKFPPDMQAIVVLGGGRDDGAPEYGEDTVSSITLERLRYTARLARLTHLPVLVSGGSMFGEQLSEAVLMQKVLEQDFGIRSKWMEESSRTTSENAQQVKRIFTEPGIRRVYLVTHAWHMPRAQWAFVDAGLDVVPAPMGFTTVGRGDLSPLGYLPSASGLHASATALRERLGFYWYKSKRDAETAADVVRKAAPAK
ncbi:MAG TPA: YdcF family protein [Burkholderiales bacterium]|nr:YdcF family protein [Burkholderiales bacterium]